MRKIIADKMVLSKNTIPHYYVSMDVDMTEAVRLRENINGFLKDSDIKLSYNDILIKASSLAIREFPVVNSYVDGEAVVFKEEINIGIAVALEDGLIVPVIKNADKKGLKQIAFEREQLIEKARTNKLLPDEFSGGSFTISSLGMFGVDRFTAIINHPETAILAVGRIKKQPVVEKDNIVIRPIMNLTLSADHRVIDGALAAAFLNKIKEYLENPFLQLMEG
jgi:pyruvate dehydrogenase E2 component (dihydrolipoamide acetyltransferase)